MLKIYYFFIKTPLVDSPLNYPSKLLALDLFCGCGGMSKCLTDAGIEIIAGIDKWDKAICSYKLNFKHPAICVYSLLLSVKYIAIYDD